MHQLHLHTQQGSYIYLLPNSLPFMKEYILKSIVLHLMFSCHKQTLLLCHLPCVTSWHQVPQRIYWYSQDTLSM